MYAPRARTKKLMQMPTGDGLTTAGPTFEYVPPGRRRRESSCDASCESYLPSTASNDGSSADYLRNGDALVVWRLDRRSLRHLLDTVTGLNDRGVGLVSLTGSIDTSMSAGRLSKHVFAGLADFAVISTRRVGDLSEARSAA
jgi:hypothetical protein